MILDELRLYIREQLARSDQLRAAADRQRQELATAPRLWRIVVGAAAVGILCGALGYQIGATPPAPIIIQFTGERR